MAQAKIKQIKGLVSALDAIAGIDNIVESFTTTASDGDTGITLTYSCRETDAIQILVNGHVVESSVYSWKKDGSTVSTADLEANTELVWNAANAGYSLDNTDIIEIRYQTNASGTYTGGSGSGVNGTSGTSGVDGSSGTSGTSGSGSSTMGGTMTSSIIPDTNAQYDLGSAEYKIRHLYLSNNSLYMGDTAISLTDDKLNLPGIRVANEFDITTQSALAQDLKSTEDSRITTLYSNTLRKACSPLWMRKNDGAIYVGSGSFVSLDQDVEGNPTDLAEGWYLTCAHNIIELINDEHQFTSDIYVGYNGKWYLQNSANIYYDGVADVALIRTGIQLTEYLKLAQVEPITGQPVWICGFPGGYDNDSLTHGIIRDAHFNLNDSAQAVDSLFLTAPGIGGNSGSAILNAAGDIIGIYTFGYTNYETLGGGANLSTLAKSIEALKSRPGNQRNHQKKYLGIDWLRYSAMGLASNFYPAVDSQGATVYPDVLAQGCVVSNKAVDSPLAGINDGDLILRATLDNGAQFTFGYENDQLTPGKVIYEYDANSMDVLLIRNGTKLVETVTVPLGSYATTTDSADYFLVGGAAGVQVSQTRWL